MIRELLRTRRSGSVFRIGFDMVKGKGELGAPSVDAKKEEDSDDIYEMSVSGGGFKANMAVSGEVVGECAV